MSLEIELSLYVKSYGFLSFAKNIGKNLSNKYSKKFLDRAKKSAADALKTPSKRAIRKTAEATGDLIGNKITDKITKKPSIELHSIEMHANGTNNKTPKERYISPEERQQIIDELRLI